MKTQIILGTILLMNAFFSQAAPSSASETSVTIERGGAGPGGGNISHVQEGSSEQRSRFADQIEKAKSDSERNARLFEIEMRKRNTLADLDIEIIRIKMYAAVFKLVKYPFSASFQQHVDFDKAIASLEMITNNPDSFMIDDTLRLNGKPMTFLSYPDVRDPQKSKLVMNVKLFNEQKAKFNSWAVTATVFHEGLRLQDKEGSDSYPYTNEFTLALRDAYEQPAFWQIVFQDAAVTSCGSQDSIADYLRFKSGYQEYCVRDEILRKQLSRSLESKDRHRLYTDGGHFPDFAHLQHLNRAVLRCVRELQPPAPQSDRSNDPFISFSNQMVTGGYSSATPSSCGQ